ncbi:6998_t:CDS:1, partial [Ambispora leptoticha]
EVGRVFKPSSQLRGTYIQKGKEAGHRVDITFDTNIPSLNPDQTGVVSDIKCTNNKQGDDIITLTIKDSDNIKMVDNWPRGDLMLLISHEWECFGNKTTQFFLANNKTIEADKLLVHFTTKPCDVLKWSKSFSFDLSWEKPTTSTSSTNDKNKQRRRRKHRRNHRRGLAKVFDDSGAVNVDKSNTIDLSMLYNATTGKSSHPNIPLIKTGQSIGSNGTGTGESLVCANCYVNGQAAISLHIEGTTLPNPQITNATISMDGNLNFNFDLSINGEIGVTPSTPDIQIFELPLSPLGVPNVFNIGPSLILAASAQVSTSVTGTVYTGGSISYPHFHMSASLLDDKNPNFQQFGFDATTTPKDPSVGVTVSTGIAGSLKPQIALSVDIMNGLLQAKTGFQVITTLGADITVGSESGCNNPKQPHIETALTGGLGFFVQSFNLPTLNFPKKVIAETCV